METPETEALFAELFARCGVVEDLDGPQVEAFVSGLLPMFDDESATATGFVNYCIGQPGRISGVVCAALAEVSRGDEPEFGAAAATAAEEMLVDDAGRLIHQQIGASVLSGAWTVRAPFGRSIMLGFDNPVGGAEPSLDDGEEAPGHDLRHSVLVEVDEHGTLTDLQLSGPAEHMVDDAGSFDGRVVVEPIEVEDGLANIIAAWPAPDTPVESQGPGIAANEQFVRHRIWQATGTVLSRISLSEPVVDVRRGLNEDEFAEANRAALSTLQAALGDQVGAVSSEPGMTLAVDAWAGVVRGDGGDLSGRERDALLWLEWADWLGAGIGLARAGDSAEVSGAALVDYVNRCPEVSSSVDKADRDYAEWAFAVAIDVLEDAGAVADGQLTAEGRAALLPALVQAWS